VTNPFDPFGWLESLTERRGQKEPGPSRSVESDASTGAGRMPPVWWLEDWLTATSTWGDMLRWRGLPGVIAPSPERVLLDLVEGVAGRFTGRQLSVKGAGGPISCVLDSLRVQLRPRRGGGAGSERQVEVRVEGEDLVVHGWTFDEVEAVARKVRLSLGLPSQLTAEAVDVVVRVPLERALRFLEHRTALAWTLDPAERGLISARPQSRPGLVLLVEPVFAVGEIRFEVRAVTWKDHRLTVPGWLRVARSRPLPELPGGGEVVDAVLREGMVTARLRYGEVTKVIDLDQLRAAVQRGEPALSVGP
jgi:hypothetical protein